MLLPIDSYLGMEQKPARKVHYHFISFSVSVLILISSEKTEKKTCVSVLNWYHRAIFRHLNFKKWSKCKVVFCNFLLSSKKNMFQPVSTSSFLTNAIPGPSPRRVQVRIGSSPVGTAASFKAKIGTVDLMNFYVFWGWKKNIPSGNSICTYIYIHIHI